MIIKKQLLFFIITLTFLSCGNNQNVAPLDEQYLTQLKQEREAKDLDLANNPNSPFNVDSTSQKGPLKYFEPSSEFIFKSRLYKNEKQDTIKIFGTRGEARKALVEGHILLDYKGKEYKLNIYKSFGRQGQTFHIIWFTDQTTGKSTYPVGRYLLFELNTDPEFEYEIDFNRAYNPYCAYSELFTCPIPTKDDYIDFEILAGEKNYHTELNTETK